MEEINKQLTFTAEDSGKESKTVRYYNRVSILFCNFYSSVVIDGDSCLLEAWAARSPQGAESDVFPLVIAQE